MMIRRVQMAPGLSGGGEGACFSVVAADASDVIVTCCKGSAILACSPSKRADACFDTVDCVSSRKSELQGQVEAGHALRHV